MRRALWCVLASVLCVFAVAATALAADITYTYDALGRLIRADYTNGQSIVYNYDAAGNRTSVVSGGNPPTANPDNTSTTENVAVTFDPRTNDTSPLGYTLSVTAVTTPGHGTAAIAGGGTQVTYTPANGYSGTDTFSYTISDGHGGTSSATVTASVSIIAPTAVNDSVSTTMNVAKTYDPRANDTDPYSYTLTITGNSTPSHGSVTINSGMSLTYTPTTSYTGSDSFTYTISDGHGNTATATENVTITMLPPVAVNDSQGVSKNQTIIWDPRANDSDPYSYPLTITAKSTPSHGTVTIINNGTQLSYTPTTNYTGSDSFTYTISDGQGNTATATESMTVSAPINPPVAVNDSATYRASITTGQYVTPTVTLDPRTNDTDQYGYPLLVISVTQPTDATIVINGGGTSVTYTYNTSVTTNLSKADTFTYTIEDSFGNRSTATVTVNISVTQNGHNQ